MDDQPSPSSVERLPVKQCRVIITPWRSGHVTIDVVSRRWSGADHWDRRSGHADLDIDPSKLAGCSCRDIIALLAEHFSAVEGD